MANSVFPSGGDATAIDGVPIVVTGLSSGDVLTYNGTDWVNNPASTLQLLTADPGAPANDTWWAVRVGTSPTQDVSVKARIGGVTTTIAEVTQ